MPTRDAEVVLGFVPSIFFHTDREISEVGFLEVMRSFFSISSVAWTDNLFDQRMEKNKLYVEKRLGKGQFYCF